MLNEEQKYHYFDKGYCILPGVLSRQALHSVREAASQCIGDTGDPGRVTETDGKTVRGLHGTHLRHEVIDKLCRHPILLDAAQQLLQQKVYVHQFKLNVKAAFVGDVWEWHQDMTFYHHEDELPAPDFLTIAVFLDDVTEFNGPLTVIPRSHEVGFVQSTKQLIAEYDEKSDWLSNTTAKLRYTVDHGYLARLVERYGLDAPKGRAGDALVFHANLFHASGANISPYDRQVAFISYNAVSNLPKLTRPPRPEFLAARDFQPLSPCLDEIFQ